MIKGISRRFRPFSVAWLTFMWCVLFGEFSAGNIIAGIIVGLIIVLGLPLPEIPVSNVKIRWSALLLLLVTFFSDLVISSLKVSWLAIRREHQPPAAIIKVPMRVQEDMVFAIAVTLLNLTPGGTVTDLDIAGRMLTMHILDGRSTSAIEKSIASVAKLERDLIRIFEGVR